MSTKGILKIFKVKLVLNKQTTTINDCQLIELPISQNPSGNKISVNSSQNLPFKIKRVYYLHDVPREIIRGGHGHKASQQYLIAVSGSFDVVLFDGRKTSRITLSSPNHSLYIVPGIWRTVENFSLGSVCLVLTSTLYSESDYINNMNQFRKWKLLP